MDVLELGLAGKVAIVTGASEGLGRATAERFARSGAKVAMCARRKDVLERAADLIRRATGADLLAVTCDVTRPDQIEAFVAATVARWGGVDIDRKSTRLNSSHVAISYAVFCLKKKNITTKHGAGIETTTRFASSTL